MDEYIPVPVDAARKIAEEYHKSIVIIFSHDPEHGLLHTTTYGTDPQNKAWAAQGGEIAAKALGCVREVSVDFEDYRLEQSRRLLGALKAVIKITGEAFAAWYEDQEIECGNILRALCDPKTAGYRADIDGIHEAIKTAERFLSAPEDGGS